MIIDFHTHCYPDLLAERAVSRIPKTLNIGPYFDGTLDGLKEMMQKAGIDSAVTLNVASRADTVRDVNNWAIRCNNEKNIIAFGAVHPLGDYSEELKRLKDSGIKGIKLHPHYQHFFVNDKNVFRMYEEILKNGFIMLFHCGLDAIIKEEYCMPKQFKDVLDNFEGEKIVAAHLGGTGYFEDCIKYIYGRDVYIDTAIAYKYFDQGLRKILFSTHDNSKILFGSDMPWADPIKDIQRLKETVLDTELYQKIIYQNAKKLLAI